MELEVLRGGESIKLKAEEVYNRLDKEFDIANINEDEWSSLDLADYMTDSFKQTRMGLVLDNAPEIKKVYTAVFPSELVLDRILSSREKGILLFTHHPMIWDTNTGGFPFRNIPARFLEEFKQQGVSHYAIHVPLDRNGPYSTTTSFAKALNIEFESEFFEYHGVQVGVIGKTNCKSVSEMSERVRKAVGHQVKLWSYADTQLSNQKVAVVAGGGNYPEAAEELAETDVRTYITGVTRKVSDYEPSLRFHEICEEHGINVIAATHYSTEKFACISMLEYFKSLGIPSEFLTDEPSFNDYE